MTARWLSVVGIGEDGMDGLSPAARALLEAAEVLVGGARHLAMVPPDGRERLAWPSPPRLLLDRLDERRGRRVCVLATGDPMCFGVGNMLVRRFRREEMSILPAPSAFALACARLGWPEHEAELLTLHGRPLSLLEGALRPGARPVLLSADASTPAAVARLLAERGYGDSRMWVLERMGGPAERVLEGRAGAWPHPPGADLNTIALDLAAGPGAALRPRVPGLPDEAFASDGQLTKREVRAATLAALAPAPRALLWDIGAGSGSVAIEWLRAERTARAVALEPRADRRATIAANAAALGAPRLEVREGRAPAALAGLEAPDAVFVGGGASEPGVLDACWDALRPGGRLVANVVTVEGEAAVLERRARLGGDLARIAVARAAPVGPFTGWRPLMPVTQWSVAKPWDAAP